MMVMGRDGKFWADAEPANANVANKAVKTILRIWFLQRAISNLMVRSAATPRVSNHDATGLAAILRDGASRLLRMRIYSFA